MTTVVLDHGTGGAAAQELLSSLFLKYLTSPVLHCLEDSALLEEHTGRLAFSTDCYINEPLFFKGGNIGSLAVNGTINNLAMRGAMPLALSLGVILEEGFLLSDLDAIIRSVARSSERAEVAIVAGDTRVVPRGSIRGICLNVSGIGLVEHGIDISGANIVSKDSIIVSGTLGDHDLAIKYGHCADESCAEEIQPLHFLVQAIIESFPDAVHALRDPTRGGLATSLLWLASASAVCMEIEEQLIPISEEVKAFSARQGLDPLYLGSAGRCILCCDPAAAKKIVKLMRTMEAGKNARIIGHVSDTPMGRVRLHQNDGRTTYLDAL